METKKCPFCFEEIKYEAKKCKHCGEFFKENLDESKKDCWLCLNCNEEVDNIYDVCWNCGIDKGDIVDKTSTIKNPNMWHCKRCKTEIENTYNICWNCGADNEGNLDKDTISDFHKIKTSIQDKEKNSANKKEEKHGFPALLSLFLPGVGQLIKGHFITAIAIWVIGTLVAYFLWWTYIIPFGIWVWNVYDAYNTN